MSPSPLRAALAVALLVGLLVAGAVGPTVTARSGPRPVGECATISEPGRYVIEENRTYAGTAGSTACITVEADDVVLEGSGTTFDGRGISDTTGIRVVGASNVTVRNLTVTDWHEGVHYVNATDGAVRNVHVSESPYGVAVENSTGVTVTESRFSRDIVGVRLRDDRNTRLSNNTFTDVHARDVYRTTSGNATATNASG